MILRPSCAPSAGKEPESSLHVVAHCPALIPFMLGYFGFTALGIPLPWTPSQVVGFLKEASINLLEG